MENLLTSTRIIIANTDKTSLPFGYILEDEEDYDEGFKTINEYCRYLNEITYERFKRSHSEFSLSDVVLFTPYQKCLQIRKKDAERENMYIIFDHLAYFLDVLLLIDSEKISNDIVSSSGDESNVNYLLIPKLGDWKTIDKGRIDKAFTTYFSQPLTR